MYPSAGGLFPLEFYIIVFVSGPEIPSGVYHYKVLNHELEVLLQKDFTESDMGELFRDIGAVKAGFAIITSACFERTQRKYSERGYRNILLEAGHVGQNILLCAESLEIKACPIAGTKDENIEKLLDIDGVTESLVHAFLFD